MENLRKIPMEKLSKNAERIWKVLSQFPEGTSAKQVMQITAMGHSWVYNGLKELEEKGFVRHESSSWIPKAKEKPSTDLCGIPPLNFNINLKLPDKSSPMSEYEFLKWYIEYSQKMVKEAINKRRRDRKKGEGFHIF